MVIMMKNRVITISRQFGSGGRTIGKEVAAKLGIPCYDQEVIEKIAEKSGFTQKFVEEHSEDAVHGNWFANAMTGRNYYIHTDTAHDYLWMAQREAVLELAQKGPCVIVGRCADHILRDTADCLTVFIHADAKKRAERIVQQYGERNESPEKRLKDKDKKRAAYYQVYTDTKWGEVENYHIALDSGSLGIEKCVEILSGLY